MRLGTVADAILQRPSTAAQARPAADAGGKGRGFKSLSRHPSMIGRMEPGGRNCCHPVAKRRRLCFKGSLFQLPPPSIRMRQPPSWVRRRTSGARGRTIVSATNSGVARTVARGPHIGELFTANRRFGQQPSNPRAEVRLLPGPYVNLLQMAER
jgi:hypothetical protein